MGQDIIILITEALLVYGLVLGTHALRYRFGLGPFYALLGGGTAIMSWVTDAGLHIEVGGITFMIGSTVFYTAILLGVFVVYIFDGPWSTRIAILTVAGISALMPLVAAVLHLQMGIAETASAELIPSPSLRINTASVMTTIADMLFLAIAWEFLGKLKCKLRVWARAFMCLLGVVLLDVLLFNTAAFGGTSDYLGIMLGTLSSRLIVAVFAYPVLLLYLLWENRSIGAPPENRPVLAIIKEATEAKEKLTLAQQEIERRKKAEKEKEALIDEMQSTLDHVREMEGLLNMCSQCKKIHRKASDSNENEEWVPLEDYITQETSTDFSHGLCPDCLRELYPDYAESVLKKVRNSDKSGENSE